jgi:hypothetical protein
MLKPQKPSLILDDHNGTRQILAVRFAAGLAAMQNPHATTQDKMYSKTLCLQPLAPLSGCIALSL